MKILNNLSRFYRRHKKIINIGGLIIIGCLLIYGVVGFFTENTSAPIYGNRLNGIKKVEIKKEQLKEVNSKLEQENKIKKAKVEIEGKMIQAVLTVEDDASLDEAKNNSSKIVSLFDEDELNYYDIEIYVQKEDETKNNFPIIGHKKAGKDNISWTKDREVTK